MGTTLLGQPGALQLHEVHVRSELIRLGLSRWAMWHSEAQYLPRLIHPGEHIGGVIYGYRGINFALLVATERRVIYLDKKPFFTIDEELGYDAVIGVSYGHGFLAATVVLHTRFTDYRMLVFNDACAHTFVTYIESRCLEHQPERLPVR